ncbi:MAG TPA: ABC transporter substrate-binding protein [Thermoanaerobaculia bacterium]|nr:ABC transporter substrate-binding protein [Thermoanaerobaculia bacterium]
MRPRARLVLLPLVLVALAACGGSEPKEYKIGSILALSGRGKTYSEEAKKGMELAVEQLNAGEFKETPIRLIEADSGSDSAKAVEELRTMADQEHVPVVVGMIMSDEILAAAPESTKKKVVILSPNASSDDIKNAGDYIFRNRESAALQSEALARAAVERFARKKIAILHSTSANAISYRDAFVDAVVSLGAPIPSMVSYEEGKTDYTKEIAELRSRQPDAVYLAGLDKEMGLILKEAQDAGFAPQFFASAGAISDTLLEAAGPAAEGLVSGSAPFDADSEEPHIRSFVAAYEKRYGARPGRIAANAYDAVNIVASVFKKGAVDADAIKAGLYAVKDYPGVGGTTTFDSFGEVQKPIVLFEVQNGKFRPLT